MIKYLKSGSFFKFMKFIDDKSYSNRDDKNPRALRVSGYQAAYSFEDNIIKIVKVHTQHNYGGGYWGFLQIQKSGLDASLESIAFLEGNTWNYMTQSIEGVMLTGENHDFLDSSKNLSNSLLKKFGKEFKLLFEEDKDLKKYLSTHFTALVPYLK
jgi:hypothetical protein